jgi:hypothetical protein
MTREKQSKPTPQYSGEPKKYKCQDPLCDHHKTESCPAFVCDKTMINIVGCGSHSELKKLFAEFRRVNEHRDILMQRIIEMEDNQKEHDTILLARKKIPKGNEDLITFSGNEITTSQDFNDLVLSITQNFRWDNLPKPVRDKILEIRTRPAPQQDFEELWRGCPDLRSNESGDALCAMYGDYSFPNCHMSGLAVRKNPEEHDTAIRIAAYEQGAHEGREKVLDAIKKEIDCWEETPSLIGCKSCTLLMDFDEGDYCLLQSLRTPTSPEAKR